jgi:hypothetical protein
MREGCGGKEPYYPTLEALGQLCGGAAADSLVRVLAVSSIRQTAPAKPAFARTITAESPMLLVFEDLHRVGLSTVDLS